MMEVMGLIAILVNCALIGLSGQVHRMFPDMSKTQTILLIVALEVSLLCEVKAQTVKITAFSFITQVFFFCSMLCF